MLSTEKREELRIAVGNLRSAKSDLAFDDDVGLRIAAFMVQQTIEILLKLMLTEAGVTYRKTHDIGTLLGQFPDGSFPLNKDIFDELASDAFEITYMEANSRYNTAYLPMRRRVEFFYKLAETMIIDYREVLDNLDSIAAKKAQSSGFEPLSFDKRPD